MKYVTLGSTDIKVSHLCLGTVFRADADEDIYKATIESALDAGCNFFDCSNIYREGRSEQLLGEVMRGRRDRFVVTTKVGGQVCPEGGGGLAKSEVIKSCEQSLERLNTDYVDYLLCHFPDPVTPIEETLQALDQLIKQGKVRHVGCSNFENEQLREAIQASERNHYSSFVCHQAGYSLLDRRIESELIPYCQDQNIGITVYSPTMIGLLSGQYRLGQAPPVGTPWDLGPYNYRAVMTPQVDKVIETVIDVATQYERTPTQIAMAWCLSRLAINVVIIGCDSPQHVEENFSVKDWVLPAEEVERLDRVSLGHFVVIRKDCPEGYTKQIIG